VTSRVFVATPSSAPSSARVVASAPLRRSFAATSGAASLELVKQLRARTQAGILNCKKALEVSRTALVLCHPPPTAILLQLPSFQSRTLFFF
jgi:hypothetical protein